MLEIRHNETWKFIRAAAHRGEDWYWLAQTFGVSRRYINDLIRLTIPPASGDIHERIRLLYAQGASLRLIAHIIGCAESTVAYSVDRDFVERTKQRSAIRRADRRSELAKIRAQYKHDPAPKPRLRTVQRKTRADGDNKNLQRARTVLERMRAISTASKAEGYKDID